MVTDFCSRQRDDPYRRRIGFEIGFEVTEFNRESETRKTCVLDASRVATMRKIVLPHLNFCRSGYASSDCRLFLSSMRSLD